MAVVLGSTRDTVTLVNTFDPEVRAPEGVTGWILESEALEAKPEATRVTVRGLTGHEILAAWGAEDRGEQAIAILRRAVVAVDGKPVDEQTIRTWNQNVLVYLQQRVEELSRGPTAARR